jgi:hypothetical protein
MVKHHPPLDRLPSIFAAHCIHHVMTIVVFNACQSLLQRLDTRAQAEEEKVNTIEETAAVSIRTATASLAGIVLLSLASD